MACEWICFHGASAASHGSGCPIGDFHGCEIASNFDLTPEVPYGIDIILENRNLEGHFRVQLRPHEKTCFTNIINEML